MSEKLDFLDDVGPNTSTPAVVEPPVTPTPTAEVTPPPAATPVVETPAPVAATPPASSEAPAPSAPTEEPKTVPLATFLTTLDEKRALEKQLKEKGTPPASEETFVPPDPVKNPAEYAAYVQANNEFNQMNDRMNFSEKFARKEHGNELIDKVRDWTVAKMDADPAFARAISTSADPYEDAVKAFKEEEELKEYREWKAKGKNPTPSPAPASQPVVVVQAAPAKAQPVAEPIPSSIADAPSSGGHGNRPGGPGTAFDDTFG